MNLRPLVRGAAVILGGIATMNLASTITIKVLQFVFEKKREKIALPCRACRGKGFNICKLCNGNSTIAWSPMYDPIAINPCVCPTCEGNRFSISLLLLLYILVWYVSHYIARLPDWPRFVQCMQQIIKGVEL